MQTSISSKQLKMEASRKLHRFTKNTLVPIEIHGCNAIAYSFEDTEGEKQFYYAIGFKGRSRNHAFYYRFKSAEKREEYVNTFLGNIQKSEQYKQQRNQEKSMAKQAMTNKIQVGTILTGSWGYEQTNREFYQVVEKPSKFKVVLRPIAHKHIEGTECFDSCEVSPIKDNFTGAAVTKMVNAWGIAFSLFQLTVCNPNGKYYKSWGY